MIVTKTKNSILIEFTDEEIIILANDLLNPLAHFEMVASEKLANCKQRMLNEWQARLRQEKRVEFIPSDDKALLDLILVQPDYKNRQARDAEALLIPGLAK